MAKRKQVKKVQPAKKVLVEELPVEKVLVKVEELKEEETPLAVCENGKIAKADISFSYRKGSCVPDKIIAKWDEMGIDYSMWF